SNKGLIAAVITGAVYWGVIIVVIFLPKSPLINEEGRIIPSTFIDGIIPIILIFFMLIGIAFGIVTGKIKSTKDATKYMTESIKDMAGYIVLVFAIAQFIAYFNWSNLGTWLAVNGAEFLESVEFTGIGLIIGYVIFTALLNFLITSGSAKWAIEAPIFVPMFMQLGYDP